MSSAFAPSSFRAARDVLPCGPGSLGRRAETTGSSTVTASQRPDFGISTTRRGRYSSELELVGELDLATAVQLGRAVDDAIGAGRRIVRLELSRLTFCDCAGLRAIVEAHNKLLTVRGVLVLDRPTERLTELLALTHLDEALQVVRAADEDQPRRVRHLGVIE